jgi:hypothetical protein
VKRINIKTDAQAIEFLELLIAENLVFHLDDEPSFIQWATPIDAKTLNTICGNWGKLWHYCNPWELLEKNPDLYNRYIREDLPINPDR